MSNLCIQFDDLVKSYHNYVESNKLTAQEVLEPLKTIISKNDENKKKPTIKDGFHQLLGKVNDLDPNSKYCAMGSKFIKYAYTNSNKSESEFSYGGHYQFLGSLVRDKDANSKYLMSYLTFCQQKYKAQKAGCKRAIQGALYLYQEIYGESALREATDNNKKVFSTKFKEKYKVYLPKPNNTQLNSTFALDDDSQNSIVDLLDQDSEDKIQWQDEQYNSQREDFKVEFVNNGIKFNNLDNIDYAKPTYDLDQVLNSKVSQNSDDITQGKSNFFLDEKKLQQVVNINTDKYSTRVLSTKSDIRGSQLSESSHTESSNSSFFSYDSSKSVKQLKYNRHTLSFVRSDYQIDNDNIQALLPTGDEFEEYSVKIQELIDRYNKLQNSLDKNLSKVSDSSKDQKNELEYDFIDQMNKVVNCKEKLVSAFNKLSISTLLEEYKRLLNNQVNQSNHEDNHNQDLISQWAKIKYASDELEDINENLVNVNGYFGARLNSFYYKLNEPESESTRKNTENLDRLKLLSESKNQYRIKMDKHDLLDPIKKQIALLGEKLKYQNIFYNEKIEELSNYQSLSNSDNLNQRLSFIDNPSIVENSDIQTANIPEQLKRMHDSLLALNDTIKELDVKLAEIKESIDAIDHNEEDKDFSADVQSIQSRINDLESRISSLNQKINHINGSDYSNVMRHTSDRASIISLGNGSDNIDFIQSDNSSITSINQNKQINQPKENKKMTEYEKQVIISNLSTIGLSGYQNNPALFDDYLYIMYKDLKENKVDNITTLDGYKGAKVKYADMLKSTNNDYLEKINNNDDDYNAVVDKSAQDVLTIIFSNRWQQLNGHYNEGLIELKRQEISSEIKKKPDESELKNKNEADDIKNNLNNELQNYIDQLNNNNQIPDFLNKEDNILPDLNNLKNLDDLNNELINLNDVNKQKKLDARKKIEELNKQLDNDDLNLDDGKKEQFKNDFYQACSELAQQVMKYNYQKIGEVAAGNGLVHAADTITEMKDKFDKLNSLKVELAKSGALNEDDSMFVHLNQMGQGIEAYDNACNMDNKKNNNIENYLNQGNENELNRENK